MAEMAGQRGGRLDNDVTRGWANDGAFGWSRLGGHRPENRWPFSPQWGEGQSRLCCDGVGFPAWSCRHPAWCACLGVFVWVSVHVCVCVCTYISVHLPP